MTSPVAKPAAEQMTAFTEAFRVGFAPAMQRIGEQMKAMHAAMKPLIDLYEQRPELFDRPEPEAGSCHCLCGTHSEQPGVCTGAAEPGLTVAFNSPTVGLTHVQMCRNCHDIRTGVPLEERQPDMGELEAIADTCACHCWANHPDAQGVCQAASHVGTTVEDRPACLGCWRAVRRARAELTG